MPEDESFFGIGADQREEIMKAQFVHYNFNVLDLARKHPVL